LSQRKSGKRAKSPSAVQSVSQRVTTIRRAELTEGETSMTTAKKMLASNSLMRMAEARAYDCVTVRDEKPE
jgi:hypothetical protein